MAASCSPSRVRSASGSPAGGAAAPLPPAAAGENEAERAASASSVGALSRLCCAAPSTAPRASAAHDEAAVMHAL